MNWDNKEEVLHYIENMSMDFSERKALNFIEKNIYFNDDEEVIFKATETCNIFLKYASDRLKNDINFIKKIIKKDRNAFIYVSNNIKEKIEEE